MTLNTSIDIFEKIILVIGVLFGLFLLVLIIKAILSTIKENRKEKDARWTIFFELIASLTNISVLTRKRYAEALVNSLSSYLELKNPDQLSINDTSMARKLTKQDPVIVKDHHIYIRIESQNAPFILCGEITSEKFIVHTDITLETILRDVMKVVYAYRTEVTRHQTTSQLALTLQNQMTMLWRSIAGYQHDMSGLANPFFAQVQELDFMLDDASPELQILLNKLIKTAPPLSTFISQIGDVITDLTKDDDLLTEPRDIRQMFDNMFRFWLEEIDDNNPNIKFDVQLPSGQYIMTTNMAFFQAVWNPLKNAVKYTSQGSINITTKDEGPDVLSMIIIDTGPGIDPDEIENIGRFGFRSTAAQKSADGSGIGLWITKRMMDKMGGSFEITSDPGKGTSVKLTFRKVYQHETN